MRNTGIMQSKYEGRRVYSPRATNQAVTATKMSGIAERILLCNLIYIYMQGIPASNSWPCLLLLEIWKKDLILLSVLPAWVIGSVKANSGQILFKTILKVMGGFPSIQYSWLWAFSYLSLQSPLICSTSSSNVTELLLLGGQMQCGAWGPSEL